jgi:uncharacterized protein (UPF0248 family)
MHTLNIFLLHFTCMLDYNYKSYFSLSWNLNIWDWKATSRYPKFRHIEIWDKRSKLRWKALSSISNYLDAQSERHNDNTKNQVVLDVLHLTNVLNSSKENAIPNHKNLRTGRAKRKGKALWNEEIGQASKQYLDSGVPLFLWSLFLHLLGFLR